MKIIDTPQMPVSNGHYSSCIEQNGILYLSGQLPIDIKTRKIPDTIEAQAQLVLENLEFILNEAGSHKENVLQTRIYISNIDLWDKVNNIYSTFFSEHKPVRSIVPTRELHFGCLIEVEAMAVAKN